MAVPSYTTDLVLLATGSDAEGGTWTEFAAPYNAGGTPAINPENFIQGSNSYSQTMGNQFDVGKSICFNAGSDISGSFAAGDVVLMWVKFDAGTNLYDYATTGGIRFGISGDTAGPNTNMDMWFIGGDDRAPNPYGGWFNAAIDPTHTPDAVGAGGGNGGVYWYFGSLLQGMRAKIGKGEPHAVDAMRMGRAELIIEHGDATGYATFSGIATKNDANNVTDGFNRWGLFQDIGGSYRWKGLMSLGNLTNAVDFRDANRAIVIDDTPKTYPSFNKIEINNVISNVEWTSINITALGTYAKGDFECVDDATFSGISCTFTDMGNFYFGGNSTLTNTTFRGCGEITTSSGIFNTCTIDSCVSGTSIITNDVEKITGCSFISGGSNHAVQALVAGDYNWYNTTTDYATSNGSTGNEAFYNNSGGHINLTYQGGTYPYYRNGTSATTTVITPQVQLTISAPVTLVGAEVRIYDYESAPPDFGTELDGVESHDAATFVFDGAAGNLIIIQIMKSGYVEFSQQYTMPTSNAGFYANLQIDTNI